MSPIAGMPKARRKVPVEPPLSETVTIAVISTNSSPLSLSLFQAAENDGQSRPASNSYDPHRPSPAKTTLIVLNKISRSRRNEMFFA